MHASRDQGIGADDRVRDRCDGPRWTAANKVDDVGGVRWQIIAMRELTHDAVCERICSLFGGVMRAPALPVPSAFSVRFDDRVGRARVRKDGGRAITINDAVELVELCIEARYRGREWASAWVRAVYMDGRGVLASMGAHTPNRTWIQSLLALILLDPELRRGHPNFRERFGWYVEAIQPYAPAPLTATERNRALVGIAEFYERAYDQLGVVGAMGKASLRNLAFLAAERTFAYVVAEAEDPLASASTTSRTGVRRRASKARVLAGRA